MRIKHLLLAVGLGSFTLFSTASRGDELPPGVTQNWVDTVTRDLEARDYHFSDVSDGRASAGNRAHGLATRIGTAGIAVAPQDAADAPALELRLQRFGRERALAEVGAGTVATSGARAEIRRDALGLVEWFENTPAGLEQGWTLAAAPAGVETGRALVLELAAQGELRPELRPDEPAIAFVDASGAVRFHYGKLRVIDAGGAELASSFAVSGGNVRIEVDDSSARYPIVIDPLLTSPSWSLESNVANAGLGGSVSTAGDFNGDGFSDVIMGAPAQSALRGAVYLFLGGPGGPDTIADATFSGIAEPERFGFSVAAAGNVNGDAFDDIVVGAPGSFNGLNNPFGRIAVFLGNAGGTLSNPRTATNCFNSNPANMEALGSSVAGAGDVTGDGLDDVIAGAPALNITLNAIGIVCIYPGTNLSDPNGPLAILTGASAIRLSSFFANQPGVIDTVRAFGESVSGAGDIDGDGVADVLVGAPGSLQTGPGSVGAAFMYFGPPTSFPDWAQLGDNRSTQAQPTASFGAQVSDAGDLNGDGFADIAVGAPGNDQSATIGGNDRGAIYFFLGSSGGIQTPALDCDPSDFFTDVPAQYCELGAGTNARMAAHLATAGDLNGDGLADMAFSEPGLNVTHVIYGSSSLGFFIDPLNNLSTSGMASLATAGDTDGDGFSEIIAGFPEFTNGQSLEGRALIFRGTGDMPLALPTPASYGFEMNQAGANLGLGLSAGDINADGFTDIVTGSPNYEGCGFIGNPDTDEGTITVIYGGSCGPACGPFFPALCAWEGNEDGAHLGQAVSATGDVNGDGFADVLVGAPGTNGGFFPFPADLGRAYLYLGGSLGLNQTPAAFIDGSEMNAQLGYAVSLVGDVNGDGRSDAMVGEPFSDESTGGDAGSAHLYYGTPTGLTASPVWTAIGTGGSALYGSAIAGAGDVNRDGYADVLVGAPGTNGVGEAYLYLGGPTGLATTAFRTYVGDGPGAELGAAVGSGGDINDDGFSEVLIGSPGFSRVILDRQGSFGFLNGPGGSRFGIAVSASDVNGDGFSDLQIGAHWEDAGAGFAQGRVHLFLGPSIAFTANRTYADCPHSFCDYGVRLTPPADVNGDGFSDLIATAFKLTNGEQDEGKVVVRFGNAVDGIERVPQQLTDVGVPIRPVGNSPNPLRFQVRATGRSAGGRTQVRLNAEVKPLATPFNGSGVVTTILQDTGAGTAGIVQAALPECANATCKWRARTRSRLPHFPWSPWLSPPENARTEADLQNFADFEGDGVRNANDTCPTIANSLTDTDMDGVDQACDTCSLQANTVFTGTLTNRTRISGQLDDDADGRGNRCDFDYNNAGVALTASDFNDMKFSLVPSAGLMSASNCGATAAEGGSGATQRCGEFDHDGAGVVVTASDFNLTKAAVAAGGVINTNFPKCTACDVGAGWSNTIGSGGERPGRPVCQSAVVNACVYAP